MPMMGSWCFVMYSFIGSTVYGFFSIIAFIAFANEVCSTNTASWFWITFYLRVPWAAIRKKTHLLERRLGKKLAFQLRYGKTIS